MRAHSSDCADGTHSGDCLWGRGKGGRFHRSVSCRVRRCRACGFHLPLWPELDCRAQRTAIQCRNSHEVAVLIPSIDLMGGKVVQLVQGETKALEFDNFEQWVERFSSFPLLQLIDLDAAKGRPANSELIEFFVRRLPCQV